MQVNYGGTVPISTIDWEGKSSCIVFLCGCNFRCKWCQNWRLLDKVNFVNIEIIKDKILESKPFINAVVFSGGEPTLQHKALIELAKFAKDQNLLVGLQTNGYYTPIIKDLIDKRLVDKIFLDLKGNPLNKERYKENIGGYITGTSDANEKVIDTIKIINNIDFEIRTTVFVSNMDEIKEIGNFLKDTDLEYGEYILQQGVPEHASGIDIRKQKRVTIKELENIAKDFQQKTCLAVKSKGR